MDKKKLRKLNKEWRMNDDIFYINIENVNKKNTYKYIEDIVGNFVSLIQVTGNTTTNTNLEDMFCNVLIEHGVTTVNVNTSLIAFTYLLTNCISGSL